MGALLGLALPSPVGAQRTQYTCFLCPVRVATAPTGGAPSPPADHSRTVLSSDPEARSAFEGDHLSVLTSSVWPRKVREGAVLPTAHKCITLSVPPLANMLSEHQSTSNTGALWKAYEWRGSPVVASHTAVVLSTEG